MEWLQFLIFPSAVLVLVFTTRSLASLTKAAPILFWLQAGFVTIRLLPLLTLSVKQFEIGQGFALSNLAAMFVVLTQIVVASAITHAHFFFSHDDLRTPEDERSVRLFYLCSTLFLLSMSTVFFCDNLGILWIAIEATTLSSAPLVYYHRTKHSLEAAWKYLIICSVGIAFALMGTMLIYASSQYGAVPSGTLSIARLTEHALALQPQLLWLGFLFCLLGYGTKAGVFPLHSWLPDAHSEAPAPASAMLSGALLNCALFAIWRLTELVRAAQFDEQVRNFVITAGVITIVAASLMLVRQNVLKRMLAYSSIENVGLMLCAIGLGAGPLFFVLALNHSAAKVALFLVSGNIIQSTGKKSIDEIHGVFVSNPVWAAILLTGAFAITGSPPFGAFLAEWSFLTQICQLHLWPSLIVAVVVSLAVSFLAIMTHVGKIVCGTPKPGTKHMESISSSLVPVGLLLGTLLSGALGLLAFVR